MQSLSKLIVAFFLSVVFLLNTAVAYAIPQNTDFSYYDDYSVNAVIVKHKRLPDGSITEIIINPSTKGAAASAVVGAAACTQSVVLAISPLYLWITTNI